MKCLSKLSQNVKKKYEEKIKEYEREITSLEESQKLTPIEFFESISDEEINLAKTVLAYHTAPYCIEAIYETGLFCVVSAATQWEKASNHIHHIRRSSTGDTNKFT